MNTLSRLKSVVLENTPNDQPDGQPFPLPICGLYGVRSFHPTGMEDVAYAPLVALVLQGQKETVLGKSSFFFSTGQTLIVSHDLPVANRIVVASSDAPYVALLFAIEVDILRKLQRQVTEIIGADRSTDSLTVGAAEPTLVEALDRYASLIDRPIDTEILGPAAREETHLRLLQAKHGGMLRRLMSQDSHASNIANAIELIRRNYKIQLSIEELAHAANMGSSAFYTHFQRMTGTTPGRYLKEMRLLEAKRLISQSGQSVSSAAYEVGYTSMSQFSREYKRKFGIAPSKEVVSA